MLKNNPLYIFLFISKLTNRLGLGNTIGIKQLHGGGENRSYEVKIHRKERYVVRILGSGDEARLENEIRIQQAALRARIPVSQILKLKNGKYVYESAGLRATVSPFIKGGHMTNPLTTDQTYAAGKLLGQFHSKVAFDPKITNDFLFVGYDRVESRVHSIRNRSIQRRVAKLLKKARLENLEELPSGTLHGDLHIKNILSSDQGLMMLDMQSGGNGPFILDIGRSMADVCSDGNQFDIELAKAYVEGYQSERLLTQRERALLIPSVIFGSVCVIIWGCQHQKDDLVNMFTSIAHSVEHNIGANIFFG